MDRANAEYFMNAKMVIELMLQSVNEELDPEMRVEAIIQAEEISARQASNELMNRSFKLHILKVQEREERFLDETLETKLEKREVADFWHHLAYQHKLKTNHLVVFLQYRKTYTFFLDGGHILGEVAPSGEKWAVSVHFNLALLFFGILPEHTWLLFAPEKYPFMKENPFKERTYSDLAKHINDTADLSKFKKLLTEFYNDSGNHTKLVKQKYTL